MQGILFKPWKQRAIRESPLDRLWQTRRLNGLKEINEVPNKWGNDWSFKCVDGSWYASEKHGYQCAVKPRYQVGKVVYIKEAWYAEKQYDHLKPSEIPITSLIGYPARDITPDWAGKLRSPMFMPEWAARTFIKITDVRPERLRDITEEDCKAEGIDQYTFARGVLSANPPDPRWAFIELWDSINPKYPFSSNPWCWRICFNLIEDKR